MDIRFVSFPNKYTQRNEKGKENREGDEGIDGNSIYRTQNIFIHDRYRLMIIVL